MGSIQNIKIIVYDGGKLDSAVSSDNIEGKSKGGKQKKERTLLQKVLNYKQTIKEKVYGKGEDAMSPTSQMAISGAVSLAKQTARGFFNYYVSDIGRANGDSNYQAQINREIEKVTDITSIIGAGLSGAGAGAMAGGPIGAIVGGAIGLASSLISLGFKKAERERDYAHEMFKQNNSQSYNLSRANYSWQTGRQR